MGRDTPEDSAVRARRVVCQRPGCEQLHANQRFCSRRCTTLVTRAQQSAAKRSEIARAGRLRLGREDTLRMIARVKYFGRTEDERIVLAWRYGKSAAKSARYRMRESARTAPARIQATDKGKAMGSASRDLAVDRSSVGSQGSVQGEDRQG